jgi:hypothetical protein
MGFSKRGDRLRGFVNSKAMADYLGRELRQKLENSLVFQQKGAAAGSIIQTANGYDATLLIHLCNSVIAARQLRSPQPRHRRHR